MNTSAPGTNQDAHKARVPHQKRELYRLTFARADFKLAKAVAQTLRDERRGEYFDLTLWTTLAVAYARPFTNNNIGTIGGRYERFPNERMKSLHNLLITARNNTFAHTDPHPAHAVYVFPPGAWGEEGDTTIGRVPFAAEMLPEIEHLCEFQAQRVAHRIRALVQRLYGHRDWPEGEMFALDYPG